MLSNPKKKELAAYYTPSQVSDLLCNLAIKNPNEIILEPSFGGCSFLESSWKALSKVGSKSPQGQIFGCDIDSFAFNNLEKNFPKGIKRNFLHKDFLRTSIDDFSQSFTTIIGNPPFLPISKFKNKTIAWKVAADSDFDAPKKSSLWVYFILHSLKFLRADGNLFFIVPDSLLFTDYGAELLNYLKSQFGKVSVMQFMDSLFLASGTKEKTSFLMCEGFGKVSNSDVFKFRYKSITDVANNKNVSVEKVRKPSKAKKSSTTEVKYYHLEDVADVRIGIVTGANKYLLKRRTQIQDLRLSKKYYYPILSKNKEIPGISLSKRDVNQRFEKNKSFALLSFKDIKKDKNAFVRLKKMIPSEVLKNATFQNRESSLREWYEYDDGNVPEMFLLYHIKGGPRLVVNTSQVNCTNSIHRIYLKKPFRTVEMRKLLAISFLTTKSRKSTEKQSRRYYSGMLKLEPGGAKNVLLPIPTNYSKKELNSVFKRIDSLLKSHQLKEATRLADKFIFNKGRLNDTFR